MSQRLTISFIRIACAVALLIGSATGCGHEAETKPPPVPEVRFVTVAAKDVAVHSEWVGTTDGSVNAQIRARVNGYLQSRDYMEGTLVKPGTLLFKIDARQYKAALDAAKGDLGRAQAVMTKTQQDVTRYTPLAKAAAISQEELDNAVQANRAARAAVDSARATVEKAQLDLDWTDLRSPIGGIAGISVAQVGDLIGENTVLTTVSQLDPIKVSFPISEQEYLRYASRIQLDGSKPQEGGGLELLLADGNVYPERGTMSAANREVDVKTGTLMIVSLFPNPNNLIRPGQYAKVRATLDTKANALVVPERALQEMQGTFQVAVVGEGDKVSIRSVKTGERIGNERVIAEGLKAGDRVVVDGLQRVRDGLVVTAKPAEAVASN